MKKIILEGYTPEATTQKDLIVEFVTNNQPIKRSQLYHICNERKVRRYVNELINEGVFTARKCECNTTDIIELYNPKKKKT